MPRLCFRTRSYVFRWAWACSTCGFRWFAGWPQCVITCTRPSPRFPAAMIRRRISSIACSPGVRPSLVSVVLRFCRFTRPMTFGRSTILCLSTAGIVYIRLYLILLFCTEYFNIDLTHVLIRRDWCYHSCNYNMILISKNITTISADLIIFISCQLRDRSSVGQIHAWNAYTFLYFTIDKISTLGLKCSQSFRVTHSRTFVLFCTFTHISQREKFNFLKLFPKNLLFIFLLRFCSWFFDNWTCHYNIWFINVPKSRDQRFLESITY